MNQHVNAYRNRIQWLALATEIALLPLPPARAQAKRAGQAATGGFAAFIESLILSTLPDGNHGEIYGTGRAL
jgi:hypothetical protein